MALNDSPKASSANIHMSFPPPMRTRHVIDLPVSALYSRLKHCPNNVEVCRSQLLQISQNPQVEGQFFIDKYMAQSGKQSFEGRFEVTNSDEQVIAYAGCLQLLDNTMELVGSSEFSGTFLCNRHVVSLCMPIDNFQPSVARGEHGAFFVLRCELELLQRVKYWHKFGYKKLGYRNGYKYTERGTNCLSIKIAHGKQFKTTMWQELRSKET